jgi:hypothetical protein
METLQVSFKQVVSRVDAGLDVHKKELTSYY